MTQNILDYHAYSFLPIAESKMGSLPLLREYIGYVGGPFSVIDRTKTVDFGFNVKSMFDMPLGETSKSFSTIMDERAQEIISSGKKLNVFWSGGIDSTAALASILKFAKPDQITVNMTSFSITEYPLFYDKFINGKVDVRKMRASVIPDVIPTGGELIVTGEFGDQIFGSSKIGEFVEAGIQAIHDMPWDTQYSPELCDLLRPLIEKCPFKIQSIFDCIWWLNITLKWQHVYLRILNYIDDRGKFSDDYVCHFFNSHDFQLWSMTEKNHKHLKIKDRWESYKFTAKEYIFNFTDDREYLNTAIKRGSLPVMTLKPYCFMTEDFVHLRFGERSNNPELFDKLYGSKYDGIFRL